MNAGDQFGTYQIIRLIGRGAMGEVFLARDSETQRDIALKIVYRGPEAEDQDIIDAERLGAELQKRLSGFDRRVVTVHKYGEISGDLFIDMEFVDGEDLSAVLSRGPVKPGFAVHVARELCGMLENLGAFTTMIGERRFAGIIHGDLKPRNVRINRQNQVKVLDFGIAKALTHTRKYTMNVFASTAYCSPERLETQNMDSHSDLWAVGVLLYQMIANKLPFEAPSKERLERRIRSAEPADPLPQSCPEPLRRIILKMLARDPAARYQSALEVAEDLARFQKGERVLAEAIQPARSSESDVTVRTSPPSRGTAAADATVGSPRISPLIRIPRRGNRALGCVAVFGIACLAVFTWVSVQLNFWSDADKLKTDLESERVTNLEDGWNRYQALTKRMHLDIFLWGARSALRKRLVSAADDTIAEYRNSDAPMIPETQWTEARTDLYRALQLDSGDNGITGRLRLVEGQIDRVEANGSRGTVRQKKLNEAVNKFTEAADLWKRSPDPYLGLANVYIYDLNDIEKAQDALRKAAHYGHPIGKRETAQLADGYRRRADRTWRESRGFTQSPSQERDYLDKAREDYIHAEDLYQRAGLFGDAARSEFLAMQGQQRVEQRLNELEESTVSR